MVEYLRKALLFLFPLVLLFAFPLAIFLQSGEHVSSSSVIRQQISSSSTVLFGKAYSYPDPLYKWESVKERKPSVISLGTSRVLAFRSTFFKEPATFFNAGKGVEIVEDFRTFLADTPVEHQPKIIITGLDQHLFFRGGTNLATYAKEPSLVEDFLTHTWRQIYLDLLKRKFALTDVWRRNGNEQAIGLTALVRSDGYRNDGSYQYGDPSKKAFDVRKKLIDADTDAITAEHCLEYGDHMNQGSLEALDEFLRYAKERHITIIGFVPPYAHAAYEKMRGFKDSACAAYIDELPKELKSRFDEQGFGFYDFTDLTTFGSSDEEMVDATHANEKAYLRLFLAMLHKEQALRPYADATELERMLVQEY